MKKCSKCGIEKPLSEYHKDKKRKLGVRVYCKLCSKINQEARKIYNKSYQLKSLYGITQTQFIKIKQSQNNSCAICKQELVHSFSTHVDHCHKSNLIRGILCRSCNIGLGNFSDSIQLLRNAIEYLSHTETKL